MEQEPARDASSEKSDPSSDTDEGRGEVGGVGSCAGAVVEKLEQAMIRCLSSPMVIRSSGLRSNIRHRISFKSSDNGRMVFKKLASLVKALYVESSMEACFHGLRPQARFTRMTPRDQMSLGAHR